MPIQILEIESNWTSQVKSLCYTVSIWDREQWQDYLTAFPQVQASIDTGVQKIKGWDLFAEEVFHRLIAVPQAIPYENLRPEVLWAHRLHRVLEESVDFAEMQLMCRNNKLAAGEGTGRLIELASQFLPKPPQGFNPTKLEEWEAEFVSAKSQLTARQTMQQQLIDQLQGETDPDRKASLQRQLEQIKHDIGELQKKLRKIGQQMGRAQQAAQDYADQLAITIAEHLAEAITQAMMAVHTFNLSMSAFGWGEGMGMLKLPGNTQAKEIVAKRFTSDARFQAIAATAGRFQAIAALRQGAKRSRQIPEQLADSSTGSDLSRLVPSEWVRVAIEQLRSLFLKDYADESLIQAEFDGATENGQQGPVVICLDKSDSMNWNGGKKEIDSTALMLALVTIAQAQKRKARVILFDGEVRYVKDIDPATTAHGDRIDLADRCYDGGTNFMAPLSQALEAIEQCSDLREADVIFISDGIADVTDEFSQTWRTAQRQLGFKVYSLIVGEYINTDVLDKFSDRTIFVEDLDDPQVHQVFDI